MTVCAKTEKILVDRFQGEKKITPNIFNKKLLCAAIDDKENIKRK